MAHKWIIYTEVVTLFRYNIKLLIYLDIGDKEIARQAKLLGVHEMR